MYACQVFRPVAPRVVFFWAKVSFLAFSHYCGNHFPDFLAHALSWIKTYHHAKFQRNPPTGLARMMVQTYGQTGRRADGQTSPFFIYRR